MVIYILFVVGFKLLQFDTTFTLNLELQPHLLLTTYIETLPTLPTEIFPVLCGRDTVVHQVGGFPYRRLKVYSQEGQPLSWIDDSLLLYKNSEDKLFILNTQRNASFMLRFNPPYLQDILRFTTYGLVATLSFYNNRLKEIYILEGYHPSSHELSLRTVFKAIIPSHRTLRYDIQVNDGKISKMYLFICDSSSSMPIRDAYTGKISYLPQIKPLHAFLIDFVAHKIKEMEITKSIQDSLIIHGLFPMDIQPIVRHDGVIHLIVFSIDVRGIIEGINYSTDGKRIYLVTISPITHTPRKSFVPIYFGSILQPPSFFLPNSISSDDKGRVLIDLSGYTSGYKPYWESVVSWKLIFDSKTLSTAATDEAYHQYEACSHCIISPDGSKIACSYKVRDKQFIAVGSQ